MDLSLLDLVAPGVGRPVVAVLQLIYNSVAEMHECAELCQHVYERLAFLFDKLLAMEKKTCCQATRSYESTPHSWPSTCSFSKTTRTDPGSTASCPESA